MHVDISILDDFIDALSARLTQKIDRQINKSNVEYAYLGIVKSISDNGKYAVVDIGDSDTDNIPNLCGLNVAVGDTVKVFADRKDMVGAYIGVRLAHQESE